MTQSTPIYTAHKATKPEIKEIVSLLLAGVNSDPKGMGELTASAWRRLFFKYSAGPRILGHQMDTLAVAQAEEVLGYLAIQYGGGAAGIFEWGVKDAVTPNSRGEAIFRTLVHAGLDRVEELGDYTHFYLGLMADQAHAIRLLEKTDFYLADYQSVQMTSALPLAIPAQASSTAGVALTPKLSRTYRDEMERLLRLDFPGDRDGADTAAAIHFSVSGSLRVMEIRADVEKDGQWKPEVVGFVQINRYKDEQRILYALAPRLWGTPTEVGILRAVLGTILRLPGRLRVRTFSRAHLTASRPALETLGLTWENAIWRRYVVAWEM